MSSWIIGGVNRATPIIIAVIVTSITAPAAISFAIPTILEYLLWYIESKENSIAALNISDAITEVIVKSTMQNFTIEKFKQNAVIITITDAKR